MINSHHVNVCLSIKFACKQSLEVVFNTDPSEHCWSIRSNKARRRTHVSVQLGAVKSCNREPLFCRVHRCTMLNAGVNSVGHYLWQDQILLGLLYRFKQLIN